LMVNHVRTLAAHRYDNEGEQLDDAGQLRDSVNVMGPTWLTALAAPVGLRYHALHHLLPSLPYHNLGRVHRALVAGLPADSAYHRTEEKGILPATADLLGRAARHRDARVAGQYPSAPM
jgi:fatty acid desaturase